MRLYYKHVIYKWLHLIKIYVINENRIKIKATNFLKILFALCGAPAGEFDSFYEDLDIILILFHIRYKGY